MSYKSEWQKIEEWMANKVKAAPGGGMEMSNQLQAHRQEAELDYQVFLEEASRSMIRFKKPEHLIKMIVKLIDEQVRTTHIAMLIYSEGKGYYHLIDSKGSEGCKIPVGFIKLTLNNALVRLFHERLNYKISDSGAIVHADIVNIAKKYEKKNVNDTAFDLLPQVAEQMKLLKGDVAVPVYYKRDLLGVFIFGEKLSKKKFSRQEISFFTTLANDVAMALSNTQLIQDLQDKIREVHVLYEREHRMFIHTAISLAAAIDARDQYTHGHTERVTQYALAIANEIEELPEAKEYPNFKETLHIAALLHDVGKIGVPDAILNKTSQLTREEYEKIKEHSVTGATILNPIRELGDIAMEVRAHHERYDGAGYPDGLKGDDIPFVARIIFVADTFDAITSDRPYRQRKIDEVAVQMIKDNSGTQFDSIIVSAFLLAHRKGRIKSRSG
ncbi:MAG: HD domain-containing protein [Candidatus Omnitrophica bacterium]|nr:HD domain-containing protein [Candidatus Omnitrophota bacterium]MBU1128823.1 HD domain-containing protein [Candidatus Omnitrophota bacterium]MBU1783784.1 HD domain-containing protein [Candidatus Omnitrophota bacterium]MBU1852123.1 HD domain-containing protein [Candidatus Omnitrophota bacterium]